MKVLVHLSEAIDRLNGRIGRFIQWLTLAMVIVGALNALLRYATRFAGVSLSSNAFIDLQWYMFSLVFLLGAAWGLDNGAHVRVDVMYERLSTKARAIIDLLGTLLFLLPFSVMMLYVSWPPVRNSWAIRETSPDPGGLARYPIKTVILICFALLLLQGISEAIKAVVALRGGGTPAEGATGTGTGGGTDTPPGDLDSRRGGDSAHPGLPGGT
jgi:TRAP-type mannitol/chloroaromatic compound transport system permease small subunit